MKLPRRKFLQLAAGAATLLILSRSAQAQSYPSRPVRLIVPLAPGGATDIIARLIGQWLSERLGQPFVIENRPGGGGNVGTEAVVRAPADGYTLLMAGPAQAINATLYDKLNFHFIDDVTPVAGIIVVPNVLVVNPSVPVKTVPELVAYAKANPRNLNMASAGIGSVMSPASCSNHDWHRHGSRAVPWRARPDRFDRWAGAGHVPRHCLIDRVYQGWKAACARSHHCDALGPAAGHSNRGEAVPGYEAIGWVGIGAPKNTPVEIIEKLNREINAGLAYPKNKARLAELGGTGSELRPGFWQVCRRRNREVGEGDPCCQHQAGVRRATPSDACLCMRRSARMYQPLGVIWREMNWAISRSSPAPRVLRPLTTPTRSCTSRFWLIFHLPLSRVMAKRKPTMPRNMTSM